MMLSEKEKKILDGPYCNMMFKIGDFALWMSDWIHNLDSIVGIFDRLHFWATDNIMKATGSMDDEGNYIPISEREK